MALDVRRYLRSLRRALVAISYAAVGGHAMLGRQRSAAVPAGLGPRLTLQRRRRAGGLPRRVKDLHPDRGGDLQQFLRLQKHFEQAMALVAPSQHATAANKSAPLMQEARQRRRQPGTPRLAIPPLFPRPSALAPRPAPSVLSAPQNPVAHAFCLDATRLILRLRKDSLMPTTLGDLARLVGGACGATPLIITGAATLGVARAGEVTLADHPDRDRELAASPAAAVIASPDVECGGKPAIVVERRPRRVRRRRLATFARHERARPHRRQPAGASSARRPSWPTTSTFTPAPRSATTCEIGPGTTIHAGVHVMAGCVIGADVTLFPNVVLYEDTRVGDRAIIHAGAIIGAYGFGYRHVDGRHQLSAQLGHVEIGSDVEIGAGTTIDRGTYGPTVIGEGTKIDNLVMIAHNCRIGRHNLICSQVGIAGSTTTGDYVVMAGQVGVRDHVHIGDRAVLVLARPACRTTWPRARKCLGSPGGADSASQAADGRRRQAARNAPAVPRPAATVRRTSRGEPASATSDDRRSAGDKARHKRHERIDATPIHEPIANRSACSPAGDAIRSSSPRRCAARARRVVGLGIRDHADPELAELVRRVRLDRPGRHRPRDPPVPPPRACGAP